MSDSKKMTIATLLSGVCGLSYQIIYARIIMGHFGSITPVTAAVISTFLIGVGLGSYAAPKLKNHLIALESFVGIYAMSAAALTLSGLTMGGIEIIAQHFGILPNLVIVPLTILILLPPAFAIGAELPIYSDWISRLQEGEGSSFNIAYGFYNLGAGIILLAMELWIIKVMGAFPAMISLALLNIAVALWIHSIIRGKPKFEIQKHQYAQYDRATLVVVGSGYLEGAFSGIMIMLSYHLLGGFPHVLATVVTASLIGMGIGGWMIDKISFRSPRMFFVLLAVAIIATFMSVQLFIFGWDRFVSFIYFDIDHTYGWWLSIFVLIAFLLPVTSLFGAVEPVIVEWVERDGVNREGEILGHSSLANAVGILSVMFFLIPSIGMSLTAGFIVALAVGIVYLVPKGSDAAASVDHSLETCDA